MPQSLADDSSGPQGPSSGGQVVALMHGSQAGGQPQKPGLQRAGTEGQSR